jgi:hypothetical protein
VNVLEPEVEEAVACIADDADPELLRLRDGLAGSLNASSFTWRQIAAMNCHRFDRKREKNVPLGAGRTKTVTAKEEHPVNRWIRTLSGDVVLAMVRESPLWLRNGAVADRICRWCIDLVGHDPTASKAARQFLERLAGGGHGRRGRPTIGPRFPARDLWGAVEAVEAQRRAERDTWLLVRREASAKTTLLSLGEVFWRRVHGWDSATIKGLERHLPNLTKDQVVMHLAQHLVIVRDTKNDPSRWVVIDDKGWPRASAIALLAARWDVEKGWILKHKP